MAAICTLIIAAVLKANGLGFWPIVFALLAGCVVSGFLIAKRQGEGKPAGRQILMVLAYVCAAIVILPAIGLGILFLGCAVCH